MANIKSNEVSLFAEQTKSTKSARQPRRDLIWILILGVVAGLVIIQLPYWWLKFAALCAGWCWLRLFLSPAFRNAFQAFSTRSRDDVWNLLATMLQEVVLFGWLILVLFGTDLNMILATLPASGTIKALTGSTAGALAAVFAWWEGDEQSATRARLFLCGLALLSSYSSVSAAVIAIHDWFITEPLINFPFNLGYVLPVTAISLLGITLLFLLSTSWMWRRYPLNVFAVTLLRIYFHFDTRGELHSALRHLGHVLIYRFPIIPRIWTIFRFIWELLLGTIPAYFAPLRGQKSRYRLFVEDRLDRSEAKMPWDFRIWWDAKLTEQPREIKELRELTRLQADAFIALGDYVVCPKENCPYILEPLTELWALAMRMDRLLLTARTFATRQGDKINYHHDSLREVSDRLLKYYKALKKSSTDKNLIEFIQWRLKVLAGNPDDHLLNGRDQLINWLKSPAYWHEFAVHTLLSEFRLAQDWSSVIETGRILTLNGLYTLNKSDHLETGKAYWHEARQVGPGALGDWALEHAVSHLYSAEAKTHLQKMPTPFMEIKDRGKPIIQTSKRVEQAVSA